MACTHSKIIVRMVSGDQWCLECGALQPVGWDWITPGAAQVATVMAAHVIKAAQSVGN